MNRRPAPRPGPAVRRPEGVVPPNDTDAEAQVLAEALFSAAQRAVARELLRPEDFYRPAHANTFAAICALDDAGESVDEITVADMLARLGTADEALSRAELLALRANALAIEGFVRSHAEVVAEHARKRRMLALGHGAVTAALDPTLPAKEVAAQVEAGLVAAQERLDAEQRPLSAAEGVRLVIERAEAAAAGSTGLVGLPTGHADLDRLLHGLPAGSFVVVGADTSVGKTSFGVGIATYNALRGTPVLYATVEMSAEQIARRKTALVTRIPDDDLRLGRLSDQQWAKLRRAEEAFATTAFEVFELADVGELRLRARAFHAKHGLGLVVVDNLHDLALPSEAESRQLEVAGIAGALKRMAHDFGCVVVALAQLNSGPAERSDKRPLLWDIRDSRRVAQLADAVLLIFRADQYDPASPDKGIAEVNIAKNRNGRTGTVRLAWLSAVPCFADYAPEPAF